MKCKVSWCKREAAEDNVYCFVCEEAMLEAMTDLRNEDKELREARE